MRIWYDKIDETDDKEAELYHYSISGLECSHIERLRDYLDGGKLDELLTKKEREIWASEKGFRQGYHGPGMRSQ